MLTLLGCGQSDPPGPDAVPLRQRLAAINADLSLGDRGAHVQAVQDYLAAYGYFPNEALARQFPARRPIVAQSPAPGELDARTVEAVRAFQRNTGLSESGIVDAKTRSTLMLERCGVPEGIAALDPRDKFAYGGGWGPNPSFKWQLLNTDDGLPSWQIEDAINLAAGIWTAQTQVTFAKAGPGDTVNLQLSFEDLTDVLATTGQVGSVMQVKFNTDNTWSTADPTPSGRIDLVTVALHEFGHVMGLTHSSFTNARMWFSQPSQRRWLNIDDKVGASSKYDTFTAAPGSGLATDIAVGAEGSVWIIGATPEYGGFGIYKLVGGSWVKSLGGAVRIAVDSSGLPWVVNSFHEIYRRTTTDPLTGTWSSKSGQANDIGAGADGSVWIITNTPAPAVGAGNFTIAKWQNLQFAETWEDDGAVRIAVGTTGLPWVVDAGNHIYRRNTSATCCAAVWQPLPGAATDIGVNGVPTSPDTGQYAWAVGTTWQGTGFEIKSWNEQPSGMGGAPQKGEWLTLPGAATTISVDQNGAPWVTNSNNLIYKTLK
jgi:hypothetical protein